MPLKKAQNIYFVSGTMINFGILYDSMPFQSDLVLVTIRGKFVREAMEISKENWKSGQFLQVSGFHVIYGTTSSNHRILIDGQELLDEEIYEVCLFVCFKDRPLSRRGKGIK